MSDRLFQNLRCPVIRKDRADNKEKERRLHQGAENQNISIKTPNIRVHLNLFYRKLT